MRCVFNRLANADTTPKGSNNTAQGRGEAAHPGKRRSDQSISPERRRAGCPTLSGLLVGDFFVSQGAPERPWAVLFNPFGVGIAKCKLLTHDFARSRRITCLLFQQ